MYQYKLPQNLEGNTIPPPIKPQIISLNEKGFADVLSINQEYIAKLNKSKNKINKFDNYTWEEIKKSSNPYEYIYMFSNRNIDQQSIANVKPLSRSFFKMIEMIHEFFPEYITNKPLKKNTNTPSLNDSSNSRRKVIYKYNSDGFVEIRKNNIYNVLMNDDEQLPLNNSSIIPLNTNKLKNEKSSSNENENNNNKSLITAHLAEGPGGFIEALRYMRSNTLNDKLFGMTLIDKKKTSNVPGWKASVQFLQNNPQVEIISGADETGNIYNPDNITFLINCIQKYCNDIDDGEIHNNNNNNITGVKLVTGDGGFDFSVDYNYQEYASSKLIYCQICAAMGCLMKDGNFICKFFDISNFFTIQMIYLLYICFEEVVIYKPYTSRIANSEKYIICKKFTGIEKTYLDDMLNIIQNWNNLEKEGKTINYIYETIPEKFINYMKEINMKIINNQIKSINNSIEIYNKRNNGSADSIENNKHIHIQNARNWCKKYNIPYK